MIQKGSNNSKKNPTISQLKQGEVFTLVNPKSDREKSIFLLTVEKSQGLIHAVCLQFGIFMVFSFDLEVIHHPKAYFNLGEDE